MGLLQKVNNLQKKPSQGLLARASQLKVEKMSFVKWTEKYSLKNVAIFKSYDSFYYICESKNIDARTIALSVSTKDFWQGSIDFESKQFESFSKDEGTLDRFYQFFREDLRNEVEEINFLPFDYKNEKYILMILKRQGDEISLPDCDDTFIKSLSSLTFEIQNEPQDKITSKLQESLVDFQANMFIFSYKIALETLFKGIEITNEKVKANVIFSMAKVIYYKLQKLFASPSCVHMGESNEIKIVFVAKDDIEDNLLLSHLKNCLKNYLGDDVSQALLLLNAGMTKNDKGAMAFLLNG